MDVRWTCYEAKRSTQYQWFSRTHKSHGKSTVNPAQDINIPSGRLFPAIKCPAPMCLSIRDDGARAACLLMLPVAFAARSTQARMKEEEEPYLWSEKYFWLHQGWIHARPEEVGLHKVPRMSNEHLCYGIQLTSNFSKEDLVKGWKQDSVITKLRCNYFYVFRPPLKKSLFGPRRHLRVSCLASTLNFGKYGNAGNCKKMALGSLELLWHIPELKT